MPSDACAAQAREHHRLAADAGRYGARHREQRNALIRQLRAEDPDLWTYPAIGRAVGISAELVRAIVQRRT
jgi:hypothetical protein